MASERCAGCFGTGKGVNGGSCTFCAGTGSIWVPDKINYSSNSGRGRRQYSSGPSWFDNAFEDNLAELAAVAAFGIIMYKGYKMPETNWYVTTAIGIFVGYITYKLLNGPLRPLGTLLKYIFYLGLLALFIYGVYIVVSLFNTGN